MDPSAFKTRTTLSDASLLLGPASLEEGTGQASRGLPSQGLRCLPRKWHTERADKHITAALQSTSLYLTSFVKQKDNASPQGAGCAPRLAYPQRERIPLCFLPVIKNKFCSSRLWALCRWSRHRRAVWGIVQNLFLKGKLFPNHKLKEQLSLLCLQIKCLLCKFLLCLHSYFTVRSLLQLLSLPYSNTASTRLSPHAGTEEDTEAAIRLLALIHQELSLRGRSAAKVS